MISLFLELLKAYKLEKEKTDSLAVFERVLREYTPCHSISDSETLIEYLQNMTLQRSMQNEELRRMTQDFSNLKAQHWAEMKSLQEKLTKTKGGNNAYDDEELVILKIEKESLMEKVDELEREMKMNSETQLQELTILRDTNSELASRLDRVKSDYKEKLRSQTQQLSTESDNSKTLLSELTLERDQLQSKLSATHAEYESFQQKATSTQQKLGLSIYEEKTKSEDLRIKLEQATENNTKLLQSIESMKSVNTSEVDLPHLIPEPANVDPEAKVVRTSNTPLTENDLDNKPAEVSLSKRQKKRNRKKQAVAAAAACIPDAENTSTPSVNISESASTLQQENENLKAKLKIEEENIEQLRGKLLEVEKQLVIVQKSPESKDLEEAANPITNEILESVVSSADQPSDFEVIAVSEPGTDSSSLPQVTTEIGNSEINNLRSANDKLSTEVAELRERLATIESELMETKHRLSIEQGNLATVTRENSSTISQLETALSSAETECRTNSTLAQDRQEQLSSCNVTINKLETKIASFVSKIQSIDALQDMLNRRTADWKYLQKQEKILQVEVSSLASIASEKEDKILNLQDENEALNKLQQKTEGRLTILRQNIQQLESERRLFNEKESSLKKSIEHLQYELESHQDISNEWENERMDLMTELDQLRNMADAHEAHRAGVTSIIESGKKHSENLSAQLAETTARCQALEEELSDAHKRLHENIHDSNNMRRLVADANNSQDSQLKELTGKYELLTEERDQLVSESALFAKRRARELESLKTKIHELEESLEVAQQEKARYHRNISELASSRTYADNKLVAAEQEANNSRFVASQLKETLARTETLLMASNKTINSLKLTLEDRQSQLDKVSSNQVNLNHNIQALQAEKAKLKQQLAEGSRRLTPMSSNHSSSSLSSMNSSSTYAALPPPPNISYIKNVLLGFLEHKDQRRLLMPVVSTILDFKNDDEKRFWTALGKR